MLIIRSTVLYLSPLATEHVGAVFGPTHLKDGRLLSAATHARSELVGARKQDYHACFDCSVHS
jgi:hypothetical protein